MQRNFLVVAGNSQVRESLARDLRARGYTVTLAANGREAGRAAQNVSVDVALIESHLPDITADKLKTRILSAHPDCRVVVLTSFDEVRTTPEVLRLGRDHYVVRGEQISDLVRAPFESGWTDDGSSFAERGNEALIAAVDVLVGLLQIDERFFGGSSHQAMAWARSVAEALASDPETVREVVIATLLRDVGKAGIADDLLNEAGVFTDEQKESMQEHVLSGVQLFDHIDFPWKVLPIIRHHHERYDGRGYPDGLHGREIPIGARIVAVVDAYVAMTTQREHRAARSPREALQELIRGAGHQFDPEVVEVFQGVLDKRWQGRRATSKPQVLTVEPQEGLRKLLRMRLMNMDCEVAEADDTEAALLAILGQAPDLVLVDVDEDAEKAFELLREMREDEGLRRLPVAFLSRRSDRMLRLRALREGIDDFLSKDDMEVLGAHVENILVRESIRRDAAPHRAPRGITGNLEDLGLADIVQTLVIGMKTACVTIRSDDAKGKVWFVDGTPSHSRHGDLEGEEAFYEMLRWQTGGFVIEHGIKCKKRSLERDAMYLLMEGMRLMDEAAQDEQTPAAS